MTRPGRTASGTDPRSPGTVPLPPSAVELLRRSDAELVAAQLAGLPADRFLHAHLAALRAGAALVQAGGPPRGRRAPRAVWDLVAAAAPALQPWTAFFADGAPLRSRVEAGRSDLVDDARAERAVVAAEDFQDAVRAHLGVTGRQDVLVAYAS